MDIMLLRCFQSQVELQCRFLLSATRTLNVALQKNDVDRTFYAIQNLLNAGANISKALWGGGGKLAVQRKPLRDSIAVDDNSPLKNVNMRNNFEHFDERLDRWWAKSKRPIIIDLVVGPKSGIEGLGDIEKFRHFDPETADLIFWDQEFNIQAIVNEVQRILPKLVVEAKKSFPDVAE